MKKVYEAPSVEKIAFQYRDQVVVASSGINEHPCTYVHPIDVTRQDAQDGDKCCTGVVADHYWVGENGH